jgi:cytochrome d ubiquinol oxidase subunit I
MDVVLLSRIQFGFTIAFHYLFPPLSIGLSLMIVIMEGMYMVTKKEAHRQMAKFWVNIFALSFAMGVASGIVQVFAFGNNWARYSKFVGDVFGSALAAEGIFAFFLEAGFLGLMLFGWDKVKPAIHYLSTILVAFGAHFSAIWICIANSWMQTPAGFKILGEGRESRAVVTHFWEVIFNPSSLTRITHVLIGCWLTGVFIVLSVSAYYMLKKRHLKFAEMTMKIGLIVGSILVVVQLISADQSAQVVAKHQPEKLAAMEGIFHTKPHSPMTIMGYPDMKEKKVIGLQIPSLLSLLTYRNPETPVTGLDKFDSKDWPNVPIVFQTYHIMIYCWGFMVLCVILGWIFWCKKTLHRNKCVLSLLCLSVIFPYISNQAGWYTAEFGRQPWIVYHLLRTREGVSKSIQASQVLGSLIMFFVIYTLLFILFLFLLDRKIKHGPQEGESQLPEEYRLIKGEIS